MADREEGSKFNEVCRWAGSKFLAALLSAKYRGSWLPDFAESTFHIHYFSFPMGGTMDEGTVSREQCFVTENCQVDHMIVLYK